MKKGLSKLILSGAALAACAATLGTSTYAWYTTNTEVKANNIIGASAGTGDASISISGTGATGTWKNSINWESDEIVLTGLGNVADSTDHTVDPVDGGLQPVTWDATSSKWVNEKGLENSTPAVINFDLYFKTSATSANVSIALSGIAIQNTTDGGIKAVENVIDGSSYKVDILDALALKVGDGASSTTDSDGNTTKLAYKACYSLDPASSTLVTGTKASGTSYPEGDAHTYVNKAAGAGTVTYTTSPQVAVPTANLANKLCDLDKDGKYTCVPFTIFLDGADQQCYDACKGQTFKISLTFAVVTE